MPKKAKVRGTQYVPIIEYIFKAHYKRGASEFEFQRDELIEAAEALRVPRPDNLGDLIYTFKFRRKFPESILSTAPQGKSWLLEGAGAAKYRFRLVDTAGSVIEPRKHFATIKIPDATPEIISGYALNDEQALLAKVRYNRLIDVFLGITTYSLQNHLRTQIQGHGQIEIDEIYVGLNRHGAHYVVPVQAKGGSDRLSPVQTLQDIACCAAKFHGLICRPVSAQFMDDGVIALFELTVESGRVVIADEKHYRLVPTAEIDAATKEQYSRA